MATSLATLGREGTPRGAGAEANSWGESFSAARLGDRDRRHGNSGDRCAPGGGEDRDRRVDHAPRPAASATSGSASAALSSLARIDPATNTVSEVDPGGAGAVRRRSRSGQRVGGRVRLALGHPGRPDVAQGREADQPPGPDLGCHVRRGGGLGHRAEPRLRRADQPEDEQGPAPDQDPRHRQVPPTSATAPGLCGSDRCSGGACSGSTRARTRSPAIRVGRTPRSLAASDSAIWVSNHLSNTVSRINPKTRKVVATIRVGKKPENAAIADDGTIFVPNLGSNTVSRIDPATNKVVNTISVGTGPFPAASAYGDIWIPSSGGTDVYR